MEDEQMEVNDQAIFTEQLTFSDSMSIKSRFLYSLQHIQSAALFARQCHQIEKDYDGKFTNDLMTDHKAYVTGAIFACVSFLEANINELFADTVDHPFSEVASKLEPSTHGLMADLWKIDIPKTSRYSVLEKYKIAITLARKEQLDFSKPPAKDVQILIRIRNALVHFEPTWVTTTTDNMLTDDSKFLFLRTANKFPFNPLFSGTQNPFFPDKCLSHGCAAWAVKSSIEFVEKFSEEMGTPVLLDFLKPRLGTEM